MFQQDRPNKFRSFEDQISIFLPNIWAIPNVQLVYSNEPNEYYFRIEGSDNTYQFYCPYLQQDQIPAQPHVDSRLTLAPFHWGILRTGLFAKCRNHK